MSDDHKAVPANDVPKWGRKLVNRVGMMKEPGVYEFLMLVLPDGRRLIVVKNASAPQKIEEL